MFLVTGDCHSKFDKIFHLAEENMLAKDDTILVLGDMGLFWRRDGKDAYENIQKLEKVGCNIWFIDGNHENFDKLTALPPAADVGRYVSEHIRWIPRGEEFYINSKRCLALGGADSIDRGRRIPHLTWWKQEQLNDEEAKAIAKLHMGKHFDYVFSHAAPRSVFEERKYDLCTLSYKLDENLVDHTTENNLQYIADKISFNKWMFGHYHIDLILNNQFTCLYNTFQEIY